MVKCPKCGKDNWRCSVTQHVDVEVNEEFEIVDNGCDFSDPEIDKSECWCDECGFMLDLSKYEFMIWNLTDNVPVTHEPLKDMDEVVKFKKQFYKRFEHQGYYLTSNMEKIDPKDVELMVKFLEVEDENSSD